MALARPGYFLEGWYMDPYFRQRFDFSWPIVKDTKLYAKWIKAYPAEALKGPFNVEFITGDESLAVEPVIVEAGKGVTEPGEGATADDAAAEGGEQA
jgi:hypothetical protein